MMRNGTYVRITKRDACGISIAMDRNDVMDSSGVVLATWPHLSVVVCISDSRFGLADIGHAFALRTVSE